MRTAVRWIGCFVLVVGIHAGAVWAGRGGRKARVPNTPPPAAVMVERAPLPAAPTATPNEMPPAPELSEMVPDPEPPPPPPEFPRLDKVEVMLPEPEPPLPVDLKPPPKPKPVKKPDPKPREHKPPSEAAAPQAAPQEAPRTAAPAPGASTEPPSRSLPTWKGLLLGHLERYKRYPAEAQRAHQEGIVYVRFTMDRQGRVLAARIEKSANVASLDQEGLDLLQRAQPLPALPADQPGETLELIVPIQFFLKGR